MKRKLSLVEQEFISVMSRIECITMQQAEYILKELLNCTENQVKKVMDSLILQAYISNSEDNKYVLAGNKKSKHTGKINRDVIKAMYYILEHIKDAEELKLICKSQAGHVVMVFTNQQRLYEIVPISLESLYKVNLIQQTYQERIKSFDKNKIDASEFMPITVFMFNKSDNENTILEKMEALNVDMPHIIVIPESDNIEEWMKYSKYQS